MIHKIGTVLVPMCNCELRHSIYKSVKGGYIRYLGYGKWETQPQELYGKEWRVVPPAQVRSVLINFTKNDPMRKING